MPITLSTFASGAAIDGTVLRARTASMETYLNEQIVAADRTTNWMNSVHVFGPDFQYAGGVTPRLPMTGGDVYWRRRPSDKGRRFITHFRAAQQAIPVPGLSATIRVPEAIAGTGYRVVIFATFWMFEYGGDATVASLGNVTDNPASQQCATARLFINETGISATNRRLCYASFGPAVGGYAGTLFARKYTSIFYADDGTLFNSAGVHNASIRLVVNPALTEQWRHIVVGEGSFLVRLRVR